MARGGEAEQINQHGPLEEMEKGEEMAAHVSDTQESVWFKPPKITTGGKSEQGKQQTLGGDGKGEEMAACHIRGKAVVAALPLAAPTLATCTHRYFVGVDSLIHPPPPPPSFHHVSLIVTVTTVN